MKKRRVLIALEQLGVGGIETFVLNQVKALTRKNIDCYVIAKRGIYANKFRQAGAKLIYYKFEDCTYFDQKKIDKMCRLLKEYKIDEVHMNQFPLMSVLMPACLLTGIPYVVYLHMAAGIIKDPIHNAYDYFERQHITYRKMFTMLFRYASSIVAITETIKNYTAKRYHIPKKKIIVRPNAIDMDEFSTNKKVEQIKKVFLISRISIEKKNVIMNAIKLYQKLKEKDPEMTLTIAGDGNLKRDVEKYVHHQKIQDVQFLGNISKVKQEMENYDLVIAVDRCILEALCLNKVAVISGYDGMKGIVKKDNIQKCISENFCGVGQRIRSIDSVAKEILKLKANQIQNMTEENLKIIKKKLNIHNNVYYTNYDKVIYSKEEFIQDLFELSETLGKAHQQYYDKSEEIWKIYKTYEKRMNRRYGLFEGIIQIVGKGVRFSIRLFKRKSD